MRDSPRGRSFNYLFSPDRISFGIDTVLQHILPFKGIRYKDSNIPMLISVIINHDGHPYEFISIRKFIKALKKTQDRYFIRFITDLLWLEESDCTDSLYTFDGNLRDISDITWTITVRSNGHIGINARLTRPNANHLFIYDISKKVNQIIQTIPSPRCVDTTEDFVEQVHEKITEAKCIKTVDSNFHVLLIDDVDDDGRVYYHAIPIVGMTQLDANRKYKSYFRSFLENYVSQPRYLPDRDMATLDDVIICLINNIRDNENLPKKIKNKSLTYSLAEQLFSYYVSSMNDSRVFSTHDLILLRTPFTDRDIVETRMISMDDLELR